MNAFFSQWDVAVILLQIIAIDLLLGGDNAVVIAMACRKLPPQQRTKAIYRHLRRNSGARAAAGHRDLFTLIAVA
jgi:predicted tellurium resistance membrane protein TerC